MPFGEDITAEQWRRPGEHLTPKSLNDYQIVRHFHNRPLFIQKYSGTIKLEQVHNEFRESIVYAEGRSTLDDRGRLKSFAGAFLIRLCDWVFAQLTTSEIAVFAESHALALKHLNSLVSEFAVKDEESQTPQYHLVSLMDYLLVAMPVPLPNERLMEAADLSLHYGDEFPAWHKRFVENLTRRNHGITLLRGTPGTGKTSYLRKLMVELCKSHFFLYLPMRLGGIFNAPDGIQFWVEQKRQNPRRKMVVILEDAEHFLMERGPDNASAVSDLINAGDGLLGDFLQLHLICTVNSEVARLDKAVTRPGRMLAYREFKRLTPTQAQKLAAAKNLQIKPQESYSLAEIYNGGNILDPAISGGNVGFVG